MDIQQFKNRISELERQLDECRKTVHLRKDGSSFPVEVSSQGATMDGKPILVSVIRNITERKQSEEERKRLMAAIEQEKVEAQTKWYGTATDIHDVKMAEASLQNYAKELERSNQELQAFAFVASHDLQEPLRKIEAFGDMLLEESENLSPHQSDL